MKFLIKFTICFLLVQVIKADADCSTKKGAFTEKNGIDVAGGEAAYKATCDAANAYKLCLGADTTEFDETCEADFGATSTSKFDCKDNKCTVCYAEKDAFTANDTCDNAKALKTCIEQKDKDKKHKLIFKDICADSAQCTETDGKTKKNCTEVKAEVAATTNAPTNATVTAAGTTTASPTTGSSAPTVSSTGDVPSEQADTASGIELSMTLIGAAALLALARRPMLD